jgi:hypothetical protein
MNIITGYRGEAHITAQMDRDINRGIFGNDAHVVNLTGTGHLAATIVSANEIRIGAGLLVAQGCMAEIPHGTTESLTIENGSQGMQRRDLIVARYTRDTSTGVEDMSLVVKKGTPAASNPGTPAYQSGSIANGATRVEFPLYRVKIDGLTITELEKQITTMESLESVKAALADIAEAFQRRTLRYKEYPFTISYAEGTPGTRGARVTLTTDYKADIGYDDLIIIGMVIKNFTATNTMNIVPTVTDTLIYVSAYRATAAAASNVTGTLLVTCRHDD